MAPENEMKRNHDLGISAEVTRSTYRWCNDPVIVNFDAQPIDAEQTIRSIEDAGCQTY